MTQITTFDDAMAAIRERSGYDRGFISNPFAGDDAARLGLVRTARVLDLLGNPERDYPIVHVAGSKGKGSTASFIDSILRAAGQRSGRFLSPHLHSYRERFVVDNVLIGEADFTKLVADVMSSAVEAERADAAIGQLTAWEISTAMALLWFSRSICDIAVIEVGMGGTLDATNVIEPAASVITTLDYEHTAILGTTMREIASNKAGIIKPGRPVVSAEQPVDAREVIEAKAQDASAPLSFANRDWTVTGSDRSFSVSGAGWRHDGLVSSLIGPHQVDNAGLAIAAIYELRKLNLLPEETIDESVRQGIGSVFLPGRFEIVRHPSGVTFVLDGAHSPASTEALARAVRERFPGAEATIVIGMLDDKDLDRLLQPLVPLANRWLVAPPDSPRAQQSDIIVAALRARGAEPEVTGGVRDAIEQTIPVSSSATARHVVVVTGSLSTVAEARVALGLA